jgi:hypothetical protein
LSSNLTFSADELLARAKIINQLAIDIYIEGLYQIYSIVIPSTTVKSNLTLIDPTCDSNYCNKHGTCMLIDRQINCYCLSSYTGMNCHLASANQTSLQNIYSIYILIL